MAVKERLKQLAVEQASMESPRRDKAFRDHLDAVRHTVKANNHLEQIAFTKETMAVMAGDQAGVSGLAPSITLRLDSIREEMVYNQEKIHEITASLYGRPWAAPLMGPGGPGRSNDSMPGRNKYS